MPLPDRREDRPQTAAFNVAAQARRAASAAARRAGVAVTEAVEMGLMREVSALLESVWGRSPEGVPINSEILRSLVHAGGAVTVAHDGDGVLVAAAVLSVAAPAGSTYSLIAASVTGRRDRGIGAAVKLTQRAWALENGYGTMLWTFDPLVSRNGRFNLVKLGARATEYEPAFYGRMSDRINGDDDSDRLVARWVLGSRKAVAATEGTAPDPASPAEAGETLRAGPDGAPMLRVDERGLWCRVPTDVVTLRREHPQEASRWRVAVREALRSAFADGLAASHMTRDGWYLLTPEEESR
jgi:predicted GNAT superfamily acetyltransferase